MQISYYLRPRMSRSGNTTLGQSLNGCYIA